MKMTSGQKAVYIITHSYGVGNVKGRKLIDNIPRIADLAENVGALRGDIVALLGEKAYGEICISANNADFDRLEKACSQGNVRIVTLLDEIYPKSLREYEDMPIMLYCKGDVSLLNVDSFAVVGTRFPSKYGARVTEDFVSFLSQRFCIVSGMARGVDGIGHRACMSNGGKTVAVLGCGVDVVYPTENYQLYKDIEQYGLLISEYDIGTAASPKNFPARNRIISGLSRGVLVTEAGLKSGTMLTVNYALEQGKDVFTVPGSIFNQASSGCNNLIKTCQTTCVTDVNDIYGSLGLKEQDVKPASGLQLDVNEDIILTALTEKGEMHFEEISDIVDLNVAQLNSLLTKMEAVGLINKTKFNYWSV